MRTRTRACSHAITTTMRQLSPQFSIAFVLRAGSANTPEMNRLSASRDAGLIGRTMPTCALDLGVRLVERGERKERVVGDQLHVAAIRADELRVQRGVREDLVEEENRPVFSDRRGGGANRAVDQEGEVLRAHALWRDRLVADGGGGR